MRSSTDCSLGRWKTLRAEGETEAEFGDLLKSLCQQYQPVGRAEELEVERIAVCWWRLKRVWRFENSVSHIGKDGTVRRSAQLEAYCERIKQEEGDISVQLASMAEQVRQDGMSPDIQERFRALAGNEHLWNLLKTDAEKMLDAVDFPKYDGTPIVSPDWFKNPICTPDYERARAIFILIEARTCFWSSGLFKQSLFAAVADKEEPIPNHDALDRILPSEAAIERSLNRAVDRLERLQRRRKSEQDLPVVSVH